jgi:hypothetical protein
MQASASRHFSLTLREITIPLRLLHLLIFDLWCQVEAANRATITTELLSALNVLYSSLGSQRSCTAEHMTKPIPRRAVTLACTGLLHPKIGTLSHKIALTALKKTRGVGGHRTHLTTHLSLTPIQTCCTIYFRTSFSTSIKLAIQSFGQTSQNAMLFRFRSTMSEQRSQPHMSTFCIAAHPKPGKGERDICMPNGVEGGT